MHMIRYFPLLMFILILMAFIPSEIHAEGNNTPSTQVNYTSNAGNGTGVNSPDIQNRSVILDAAAIEKAFNGWYNQGMKALNAGNCQAASEAFAAALRLDKDSDRAQIGYARALEEVGRIDEARVICRNMLNSSPDDPDLLILLGLTLNTAGEHEAALPVLLNATTRFPEDTRAWNQLAVAYAGQSRYEEALTTIRKSLDISLNQSEGWEELGAILSGQGRFYEAVAAFEKAISLDSKSGSAREGLGETWNALGRYDEAVSAYLTATKCTPDKKEIWLNLAKVYEKTGKTREAADAYARGGAVNLIGNVSSPVEKSGQPGNNSAVQNTNTSENKTPGL